MKIGDMNINKTVKLVLILVIGAALGGFATSCSRHDAEDGDDTHGPGEHEDHEEHEEHEEAEEHEEGVVHLSPKQLQGFEEFLRVLVDDLGPCEGR